MSGCIAQEVGASSAEDAAESPANDSLRELAWLIAQAYKISSERLRIQKSCDLIAAQLVDLKSAETNACAAVCQAIDMCSLSDEGKLESWKMFVANYP